MKCGLGNWVDISEQYLKSKEPLECEEHYFSFYNRAKNDKLPSKSEFIVEDSAAAEGGEAGRIRINPEKVEICKEKLRSYKALRAEEVEAEAKEFSPGALAGEGTGTETKQKTARRDVGAINNAMEVVGYMPKRGDFDQEYDMDADLLLADMEFFEDDTKADEQLKNEVIELYNARIDERIRRKKFVIERGLLDLKKSQKYERKKTKEEREIINSMKIFARFNT
jgi:transcriptional adapter 2-alpha